MSKIEEVRALLERLADNAEHYGLRVLARPEHVRALLDDHARLQAEASALRGAMGYVEAEEIALQPTKGEGE